MKLSKLGICAALFAGALGLSGSASATLVDHGAYTADTATGLDWLDMTATSAKTHSQVITMINSGPLTGWRYATSSEVLTLIGDYYGTAPADHATTYYNNGALAALNSLLGYNYSDPNGTYATGLTSTMLSGSTYEGISIRSFVNGATDRVWAGTQASFNLTDTGTNANGEVASFLVRDNVPPPTVPEPGMGALLSLGLLGLLACRRRKQ